jgi:CHAT domain-containing protein/tetratricopeptide (TPR) repeat protein
MGVRWLQRTVVLVALLATLVLGIGAVVAQAQGSDDLATLNEKVLQLYRAGNYAEATEIAKRSLALAERQSGPHHPDVGTSLNNLALLYNSLGRLTEAEPLLKRALAIYENALGPDDPTVGTTLDNLAWVYENRGRYADAEPLYRRALAIVEKAFGPNHPDVGGDLNNLAELYRRQGRYADAELLYKRSILVAEKALGSDHPSVGTVLNNLAALFDSQGNYAEAEPLFKRALAIHEKAFGPDHLDVGTSLNGMAGIYARQGRYADAEPLFRRSIAITEKALGPNHPAVSTVISNLALLYESQGRYAEAELGHKRALAIREKTLGPDHPKVGNSLNYVAALYGQQGRYAEAEQLHKRALAIAEKALGPDHPDVGGSLNDLASLYESQGRYAEAEPLYQRSLAIREKVLGPDHPNVGRGLHNLAGLAFVQRDWLRAAEFWRRSTAVDVRRAQRGAVVGQALTGKNKGEAERRSYRFWGLVKVGYRLATQDRAEQALAAEMFQAAQWALGSEAADSLAQMAARGAKGDAKLAALVRGRQDLAEEWQKRDQMRSASVAQEPGKRDRTAETANVARLAAIDTRIAEVDKRLAVEFPDYATLARPTPLSVTDVQAQLGADEALVLFLDTPEWRPTLEETFIWVVTKTDMRWVRSDLGTPALTRQVAALRCGLDGEAWQSDGATKCVDLLGIAPDKAPKGNAQLPFDTARAHALYKALLGPVEELIRDKHLLIVPSGPLTQLPFQVLVTAAPMTSGDYKSAAWLARSHAITVLPAVSSLKALRRVAKSSAATKPMIGFGNPLLDGDPPSRPWEADWARLARQKQACPQTPWQQVAGMLDRRRGVMPVATLGGRPDLDHLRVQAPLHDTADELCAVAKELRLAPDDILLGAKATEATIKGLSDSGKLAQYRVVHFATHGTIAGEIEGASEPGLILTPPKDQTELDDGYLSASEVAALKLDADWVILSACNTAAGGAQGAEALSGLARAFFYAGARAMLVSHWSVDSAATVKLITSAVGATTHDKTLGRAEALRRAMLAMIDKGEPHQAHPAYWAPFVVVGEGAAAK